MSVFAHDLYKGSILCEAYRSSLIFHLKTLNSHSIHLKTPYIFSTHTTMSGTSNVGTSQVYEAGDQRNYKDSEIEQAKKEARFHEGKENSHKAQDSSKSFSTCV